MVSSIGIFWYAYHMVEVLLKQDYTEKIVRVRLAWSWPSSLPISQLIAGQPKVERLSVPKTCAKI